MATFDFLIEYAQKVNLGFRQEKLSRAPLTQKKYEDYKQECGNLHEHIMKTYLKNNDYCISLNMFPLDLQKNISHYVLWIKNGVDLDIYQYIQSCFGNKRFVIFTNPKEWKSIPTVIHHHIFVEEYYQKCVSGK